MPHVQLTSAAPQSAPNRALLDAAAHVIDSVVNDARFRGTVLARVFSASIHDRDEGTTDSPSNAEVADIIKDGKERGTAPDETIQISIVLKDAMPSTVLGEVEPPDSTVIINHKFFDKCLAANDATALASVLMHEWMHVAGFRHPGTGMKHDVPYEIGFIVLELAPIPATFQPAGPSFALPADTVGAADWALRNWDCNVRESPRPKRKRGKPAGAASQQ